MSYHRPNQASFPVVKEGSLENTAVSRDDSNSDKFLDEEVQWEPGLKEEMERYGLNEETINIVGREGYTKRKIIQIMEKNDVAADLVRFNIPSAQIQMFCAFIMDCKKAKSVEIRNTKDIKMTDEHQAILLKCKPFLAANMKPEMVMEILHSKMLLTKYDRDVCNEEKIGYAKVVKLLDLLSEQTEGAFWGLIRALERTNQKHLANMIEECVSKEGRLFIYTLYHIYLVYSCVFHSKMLLTKYDRDVCNVEKIGYDKVVKLLDLLSQQTEGAFWGHICICVYIRSSGYPRAALLVNTVIHICTNLYKCFYIIPGFGDLHDIVDLYVLISLSLETEALHICFSHS